MTSQSATFGQSLNDWATTIDWSYVAICVLLVVLAVYFRRRLAKLGIRFSKYLGAHIGVDIQKPLETAIRPATEALIVLFLLLILLESLMLPASLELAAEKILFSAMIIAVFAAFYALCKPLAELLQPYRSKPTRVQIDWIVGLAKVLVVALGVAAVLKVWGIDIGLIVTGMSIAGAAIALAGQDLVKNLIAGITNAREKRFHVGEWIRIEGVIEGTVERVEFRSTLVKRFDMARVFVPNAELANATLINFSRQPHRRIYWKIGVTYRTTKKQLTEICKKIGDYINKSKDFVSASDATSTVHVAAFNDSSIDILVYCFTQTDEYEVSLQVKEKLVLRIKDIVEACGTSFAFPSRSIYVEAEEGPGSTATPRAP